jgi:hypothetical protein
MTLKKSNGFITLNSCTVEMKRHEFTVMYPFHLSSTWVYSHAPVSFLQYTSLQSCTRFISPLPWWNGYMTLKKSNGFITLNSCTVEMKRVHYCNLMYWRIEKVHDCKLVYCSSVHEFTVMYPFHFFSTWVYSHAPVSFLQYTRIQSCTHRYMTVNSCTGEMKRVHDCRLMYWRNETGTWL